MIKRLSSKDSALLLIESEDSWEAPVVNHICENTPEYEVVLSGFRRIAFKA